MKEFELVKKTVVSKNFIRVLCDWCGKEIVIGTYEDLDTTIQWSEGYSYPDNGARFGWEVEDLCSDCGPKLRDLLKEAGITTRDLAVEW
jgi:hypothetical protein